MFNDILFSLERQHYTVFPVVKPSSDVFCCETENFEFVYILIGGKFKFGNWRENLNSFLISFKKNYSPSSGLSAGGNDIMKGIFSLYKSEK